MTDQDIPGLDTSAKATLAVQGDKVMAYFVNEYGEHIHLFMPPEKAQALAIALIEHAGRITSA